MSIAKSPVAWAGGGAGAALAVSATDTEVAEALAELDRNGDMPDASAVWCSEGAPQPAANNKNPVANARIGSPCHEAKARAIPSLCRSKRFQRGSLRAIAGSIDGRAARQTRHGRLSRVHFERRRQ